MQVPKYGDGFSVRREAIGICNNVLHASQHHRKKKPPNGKRQNEPFAHFVDVVGSLLHFACNVPLFCVSGLKNGSNCNSAAKGECTASCTARGEASEKTVQKLTYFSLTEN